MSGDLFFNLKEKAGNPKCSGGLQKKLEKRKVHALLPLQTNHL